MEINNLNRENLFVYLYSGYSFWIKLSQSSQIWLFNCFEGCQHVLAKKKVRISQISKIILTDSHISSISGLLGLLSSISLSTKMTTIDIYAPQHFHKYIFFCRKYSQTNFRYKLHVYNILEDLIINQSNFSIYAFISNCKCNSVNYFLLASEQPGFLNVNNTRKYNIPFGPLYGQLKLSISFILPDGFIVYSYDFMHSYYLGSKVIMFDIIFKRCAIELLKNAVYV